MDRSVMRQFIENQAQLHPATRAQDIIKQCFQAAFGAEHLIADAEAARRYLEAEFEEVGEDARHPLYEQIGPSVCRVNLGAWAAAGIPHEWLLNLFVASAHEGMGSEQGFADAIEAAREACEAGEIGVTREDFDAAYNACFADGVHPVHHSDIYRAQEKPAYRVVSGRFVRLLDLFVPLARLNRSGNAVTIAIDGRAASGKSTIAEELAAVTGAGLVHMDDFFLPPALRTPERLTEPGGNVDYERFAMQVLPALKETKAFSYPVFDCSIMRINGEREVAAGNLRIVEGSYSHHPHFGTYADLRVFSDIDADIQLDRIRVRNGDELAEMFRTRWIPMEETYFEAFSVREKADILL